MRDLILAWLAAHPVSGYTVTQELPWDAGGTPLYLKNFKRIYVDTEQVAQEPLIDVLNGTGVVNQITTVVARVTTDAKNSPSNYNTMVTTLAAARLDPDISGVTQRITQVTTEFQADAQVTEFEYSFTKLIVNT
jgi:hypothetical protein